MTGLVCITVPSWRMNDSILGAIIDRTSTLS
nr:MAG TPA: Histone acetyltransferase KAT8 [Caudoviricetes sp.]